MKTQITALLIVLAAGSAGALAGHQDHRLPGQAVVSGTPTNVQRATLCVRGEQRALAIAEQISRRSETAQRDSRPADLRNAIDDLQAALSQLRTTLGECAVPADTPAIGIATSKPAVSVDHAAMGHPTPATTPADVDQQLVNACVQGQQDAAGSTERQIRRLELARQTNGAAEMRAGIVDLQAALGELRTSLEKCRSLRAAVAAAEAAAAAATMDHSKMAVGAPAATAKPGAGTGAKSTKPLASTAPTDHSKMPMGDKAPAAAGDHAAMKMDTPKLPVMSAQRIADPACPHNITQANAPRAVYQRKVYFFCSTAEREQFRKDPAGYLKRHPR